MIRFKVIRGSHLLLGLSILILTAVIVLILLQSNFDDKTGFTPAAAVTQCNSNHEAKVLTAFASNPSHIASLEIEIKREESKSPPLYNAPAILIYHTHTHEAYEQNDNQTYAASEAWRTADERYNVVRIGTALEDELGKLGFFVVHDTTDHELDDLDHSYVRALESLESYSMEFDLIIDLHRDAYTDGMQMHLKDEENSFAQIMLLVGDGGNYQGTDAPDYENNLAFAHKLTKQLNQQKEGIARNITVKHGRFNQHLGKTAALIEVGHNKNTLDEALASIPVLAKSIEVVLRDFRSDY